MRSLTLALVASSYVAFAAHPEFGSDGFGAWYNKYCMGGYESDFELSKSSYTDPNTGEIDRAGFDSAWFQMYCDGWEEKEAADASQTTETTDTEQPPLDTETQTSTEEKDEESTEKEEDQEATKEEEDQDAAKEEEDQDAAKEEEDQDAAKEEDDKAADEEDEDKVAAEKFANGPLNSETATKDHPPFGTQDFTDWFEVNCPIGWDTYYPALMKERADEKKLGENSISKKFNQEVFDKYFYDQNCNKVDTPEVKPEEPKDEPEEYVPTWDDYEDFKYDDKVDEIRWAETTAADYTIGEDWWKQGENSLSGTDAVAKGWFNTKVVPFFNIHKNRVWKNAVARAEADFGTLLDTCVEGTKCRQDKKAALTSRLRDEWRDVIKAFRRDVENTMDKSEDMVFETYGKLVTCEKDFPCCDTATEVVTNWYKQITNFKDKIHGNERKIADLQRKVDEIENECPEVIKKEPEVI